MFAEILFEEGLGENRALVLEGGQIVEAHVERMPNPVRAGDVWDVRLTPRLGGRRAIVSLGGTDALLEPVPADKPEGATLRVEVVREAIPEPGRPRLPKVVASGEGAGRLPGLVRRGPDLRQRLSALRLPIRTMSTVGDDAFEAAGWSELLEEAASGRVSFDGGQLAIAVTPAMTLIDVDGDLPPPALARAGAEAAARAIRRFGVQGSIGIDLPTLTSRSERQALATIIDAVLPQPFERTSVNGFGFLQIVRRRVRPSILELAQGSAPETAALALLRRAERSTGAGERTIFAHRAVITWLEARPLLLEQLSRRLGAPARLRTQEGCPIWSGYVSVRPI
jgi:hypothetical protein